MTNLIPSAVKDSVEQLRDNVLDVFDRWVPRRAREPLESALAWPTSLFARGGPAVEMTEDNESVHVAAELPGLSEKDFKVEILNDRLVIEGEKKSSREEKDRNYFYSECSYGSFSRSIALPCEIDAAKAKAQYKNGVLNIALPKTEQARARRVKIEVS